MTFVYPHIDPVAVQLGPFGIRWYTLAYIVSLLLGWRLARRMAGWSPVVANPIQVDDFLTWATLGVVLGGRLGYVLFYQPGLYFAHPLMILQVWRGGMSFHGGLIGVFLAIWLYTRQQKIPILGFADRIAVCAPIGLGLGRVANFINGELWGRPAASWFPITLIYPQAGPMPRYPSELIEAFLEGIILLSVMLILVRSPRLRAQFGWLTGVFLIGYGICRIISECFRQPDAFLGYIAGVLTMGQILSFPMILIGAGLIWYASRRGPQPGITLTSSADGALEKDAHRA